MPTDSTDEIPLAQHAEVLVIGALLPQAALVACSKQQHWPPSRQHTRDPLDIVDVHCMKGGPFVMGRREEEYTGLRAAIDEGWRKGGGSRELVPDP